MHFEGSVLWLNMSCLSPVSLLSVASVRDATMSWLLSGGESVVKLIIDDVESIHCNFHFITEDLFDTIASA